MSGRIAARDSIAAKAQKAAIQNKQVKRGIVTQAGGAAVKLHEYEHVLTLANDFSQSQWVIFYAAVVGIKVGDLALMHQEGSDWVHFDVVSDTDVVARLDEWRNEDVDA
jgi:hypothetical protein